MFKVFLQSLLSFSDCKAFDLCLICDSLSAKTLKTLKELDNFNTHYMITCKSKNLYDVLLCKFDICKHPNFLDYHRILYLDTDIVVQKNIMDLFATVTVKKNKLYVAREGNIHDKYWTLGKKTEDLCKTQQCTSFNSGIFMFHPTPEMQIHFEKAKAFGMQFKNKDSIFYDQPVFNYYFHLNRLVAISKRLGGYLQMFPNCNKQYSDKMFLHVAGINRCNDKAAIMQTCLNSTQKNK